VVKDNGDGLVFDRVPVIRARLWWGGGGGGEGWCHVLIMVAICIKYCYVLLINLYYIPDPPFLLHAILETALTHLRSGSAWGPNKFFIGLVAKSYIFIICS
jgi:hypothetical protein